MRIGFYVTPEQHEWVKQQGKGWFRSVLEREMGGEPAGIDQDPPKARPRGLECPHCTAPLQAWMKKCPNCRVRLRD